MFNYVGALCQQTIGSGVCNRLFCFFLILLQYLCALLVLSVNQKIMSITIHQRFV